MKNPFILTIVVLLTTLVSTAQDARISRPWTQPFLINPALSGNFDGTVRVGTGGSWQQNKDNKVAHQFTTEEIHINRKKPLVDTGNQYQEDVKEAIDNRFIGLTFAHYGYGKDRYQIYPSNNPIYANFFSFSSSYNFNLSNDKVHTMGIGTQLVYGSASFDEARGLYDKEISGGGFQWTELRDTGKIVNGGLYYLDFNFGGYYRYRTKSIVFEIGMGAFHYLWPKNSLKNTSTSNKAQRARNVLHSSVEITLPNQRSITYRNIYWKEGLYFRSSKLDEYDISTIWNSLEVRDNNKEHLLRFTGGLATRNFQTFMPFLEMNVKNLINFAVSYEQPLRVKTDANYFAKRLELGVKLVIN
jgi:hypothetical protein